MYLLLYNSARVGRIQGHVSVLQGRKEKWFGNTYKKLLIFSGPFLFKNFYKWKIYKAVHKRKRIKIDFLILYKEPILLACCKKEFERRHRNIKVQKFLKSQICSFSTILFTLMDSYSYIYWVNFLMANLTNANWPTWPKPTKPPLSINSS